MERVLEGKIEDLKKKLIVMGSHVEKALESTTKGLTSKAEIHFKNVHEVESLINEEQISIDSACMDILAKQAPVAKDLRFVVSVLKINTDLERMGDMCANIAYMGKELLETPEVPPFPQLQEMVLQVKEMVKKSLDAFVRMDIEKARHVLTLDDAVDKFKNDAFLFMQNQIQKNPQNVKPAINFILIARSLERLGDHATNIAEDVIYAQTGKDIRHSHHFTKESS